MRGRDAEPESTAPECQLFVFVKIPGRIEPLERGERFEDPLIAALEAKSVGTISGGGSSMTAPDAEGRRFVQWCGIDVELSDPVAGLETLRAELRKLSPPHGTVLEYKVDEQEVTEPLYAEHPWPVV
jgi:hypothetical protein